MKYTREQARSAAADDAYKCTIELAATADEPSYLDWTTGVYSETSYLDGGDVGSISGGPPTCVQADNDAGRASDTAGDNNGPIPLSMTMPLDLTRHSVNYDAYCLTGPLQYPSGSVHLELPEGPADVGYQLTTYDGVLGYLSLHGWTGTEEIDGFGFVELDFREKTTSGCTEEFPKTLTMRGSLAVLSTEFGESHSLELPPLCPQSGIGAQCVSAPPTDPCPGGELRVGWSCVEMPDANAPSSESPPRVFGKPRDGRTLTASSGTWAGSEPVTHAYQWQRRDPDTYEWTDIPNALTSTYTPTAEDVWLPFRVLVTADNRAGSATAGSDETEYVEPAPPASTAPPAIVGVAQKGETLSATKGEWKGTLTDAEYSYQWQYCYYVDSGPCYDIDGATSERYTVEHSGAPLRVRVRIAAWAGEAAATSARTPEALPGRDCPEDEMGVGPACVFTPIAPDPAGPLAPGKSESVPPVAQPDRSQLPIFDTMTPGGGYLMPYGQAPNTTNPKMFQLYVSHVAVAAGGGRVYVAYRDGGQSGIYSGVQMFDARTLEYLGKFGEHAYGGWGVGIAYYEDEVFVADHEDAEIEVYDPTGQHLRSFPTSVAGNPPEDCSGSPHGRKVPEGDTCLLPWGLDVAWGEVWVTLEAHSDCDEYTIQGYHAGADQPPPQCSLIGVYDAKTGALKALLPHAARYGCSRDPQDGAPAAADDCASIADPSRLECEDRWPTSPGYPACTEYRTWTCPVSVDSFRLGFSSRLLFRRAA